PPASALLPYTTLFRSRAAGVDLGRELGAQVLLGVRIDERRLGPGEPDFVGGIVGGDAGARVDDGEHVLAVDHFGCVRVVGEDMLDRKSTRLNSSHGSI